MLSVPLDADHVILDSEYINVADAGAYSIFLSVSCLAILRQG